MTERQRQILYELCDPIVRIGWCSFAKEDRSRNRVLGTLYKQGLVVRRAMDRRWEYRISEAGLAALQWEIDTLNDIKRIGAIFERTKTQP